MKFTELGIKGLFCVELEVKPDERGFFARSFCKNKFEKLGLTGTVVQTSVSFNKKAGTLRGMHYQIAPHEECKLVRCTRGAIYDVVVDVRKNSESFCKWVALELTMDNHKAVYIPIGCLHGFQTLMDNSEVLYMMSEFFHPECARGYRWNDPAFGIRWPLENKIISEKDGSYRDFP
ncbi:MAG: dTDP-4-dehydrorhamnose 3,5-epimerase [Chitinivibrionales bacterium]|nr:dTDP-4-dehydrorhamnose 3,5-epimerase [Chitinivibrionales bacterium]